MFVLARSSSEDKAVWRGFPDEVVVEKPILDSILAGGEMELDWIELAGAAESDEKSWPDISLPADAEKNVEVLLLVLRIFWVTAATIKCYP